MPPQAGLKRIPRSFPLDHFDCAQGYSERKRGVRRGIEVEMVLYIISHLIRKARVIS